MPPALVGVGSGTRILGYLQADKAPQCGESTSADQAYGEVVVDFERKKLGSTCKDGSDHQGSDDKLKCKGDHARHVSCPRREVDYKRNHQDGHEACETKPAGDDFDSRVMDKDADRRCRALAPTKLKVKRKNMAHNRGNHRKP